MFGDYTVVQDPGSVEPGHRTLLGSTLPLSEDNDAFGSHCSDRLHAPERADGDRNQRKLASSKKIDLVRTDAEERARILYELIMLIGEAAEYIISSPVSFDRDSMVPGMGAQFESEPRQIRRD